MSSAEPLRKIDVLRETFNRVRRRPEVAEWEYFRIRKDALELYEASGKQDLEAGLLYATCLAALHQYAKALPAFEELFGRLPADTTEAITFHALYAKALYHAGEYLEALFEIAPYETQWPFLANEWLIPVARILFENQRWQELIQFLEEQERSGSRLESPYLLFPALAAGDYEKLFELSQQFAAYLDFDALNPDNLGAIITGFKDHFFTTPYHKPSLTENEQEWIEKLELALALWLAYGPDDIERKTELDSEPVLLRRKLGGGWIAMLDRSPNFLGYGESIEEALADLRQVRDHTSLEWLEADLAPPLPPSEINVDTDSIRPVRYVPGVGLVVGE